MTLFLPCESGIPKVSKYWYATKDGDPIGLALYEAHYSCYHYKDKRIRKLFCGPGEKTVLLTGEGKGLFVWRKFRDDSGQVGINCAVFRNEGVGILSSLLILDAETVAAERWPGERFYTYVNQNAIESKNPGYCFIRAGWTVCGRTKARNLVILEKFQAEVA